MSSPRPGSSCFRAEGALSIESPENIVENTSVLKMTNSIMAFSEPVRPVVTPWRIPLVRNMHFPGHKKMFEKKFWVAFRFLSTRSGVEERDGHVRTLPLPGSRLD